MQSKVRRGPSWQLASVATNHIIPPTAEQTRSNGSADPLAVPALPSEYRVYDKDEQGQLTAKSSPHAPKLTFEEEKERRKARFRDYKAAVSHKDKLTCPECDAVIEGRAAFKHHLKDIHRRGAAKIRECLGIVRKLYPCPLCSKKFGSLHHRNQHGKVKHELSVKQLRLAQKPKAIEIVEVSAIPKVSPEIATVLSRNGIRPEKIEGKVSQRVLEVLGAGVSYSKVRKQVIAPLSSRKKKRPAVTLEPSQADYDRLFSSPGLCLLVPEDEERKCFLLHHIMQMSLREVAIKIFGSADKKPRVQKIVDRVKHELMTYLQKARKTSSLREDPVVSQLWALVRGNSNEDSFGLEVENYSPSSFEDRMRRYREEMEPKAIPHLDYDPPNRDDGEWV